MKSIGILVIALADKREKIDEHWKWIEENIMPTLGKEYWMRFIQFRLSVVGGIDVSDDITDFIQWKIKSLCAQADDEEIEGEKTIDIYEKKRNHDKYILDFESEKFKSATKKFHQIFNMPTEEKLVICKNFLIKLILNFFFEFIFQFIHVLFGVVVYLDKVFSIYP